MRKTRVTQNSQTYWTSLVYLESAWKMHSNKYKHATFWFSNSWKSLWNFDNLEKKIMILHGDKWLHCTKDADRGMQSSVDSNQLLLWALHRCHNSVTRHLLFPCHHKSNGVTHLNRGVLSLCRSVWVVVDS